MLNRKVCVRTLARALVVSSLAVFAACNTQAADPPAAKSADPPVRDSELPEIVISAPRPGPGAEPMRAEAADELAPRGSRPPGG